MPMSEATFEAFQRVTNGYYRAPDPKDAAEALRVWLSLLATANEAQAARMIVVMYLFGRIAARSDEARATFEPIIAGYAGANASLAAGVLRTEGLPDVFSIPVERPEVLDLLWAEFFVTGAREPVARIASALDGADGVRARLEAWVSERPLLGKGKREKASAALAAVGLVLDLGRGVVVTDGDLDCLCFALAEQKVRIFPMLPVELTQPELLRLAAKGSALWSLRLNAGQHAVVAAVCRDEATRPGGKARRTLVEPLDGKPFSL
jgi:hypothetical protein